MPSCIGKKGFDSEADADRALDLIRGNPDAWLRDKVPARTYECDICKKWHLTAMTKATVSAKRRKNR